jgi:hypothetical protein
MKGCEYDPRSLALEQAPGATTFSITTQNIKALSIMGLLAQLSIHNTQQVSVFLSVAFCMVMLSVITLHVIKLNVVAPSKCKVLHPGRLRPYYQISDQHQNPTRDKHTILFRRCVSDEDKKVF